MDIKNDDYETDIIAKNERGGKESVCGNIISHGQLLNGLQMVYSASEYDRYL